MLLSGILKSAGHALGSPVAGDTGLDPCASEVEEPSEALQMENLILERQNQKASPNHRFGSKFQFHGLFLCSHRQLH